MNAFYSGNRVELHRDWWYRIIYSVYLRGAIPKKTRGVLTVESVRELSVEGGDNVQTTAESDSIESRGDVDAMALKVYERLLLQTGPGDVVCRYPEIKGPDGVMTRPDFLLERRDAEKRWRFLIQCVWDVTALTKERLIAFHRTVAGLGDVIGVILYRGVASDALVTLARRWRLIMTAIDQDRPYVECFARAMADDGEWPGDMCHANSLWSFQRLVDGKVTESFYQYQHNDFQRPSIPVFASRDLADQFALDNQVSSRIWVKRQWPMSYFRALIMLAERKTWTFCLFYAYDATAKGWGVKLLNLRVEEEYIA